MKKKVVIQVYEEGKIGPVETREIRNIEEANEIVKRILKNEESNS